MRDNFDYIYDAHRGQWTRIHDDDSAVTIGAIIETALSLLALAVCLVAVMMLWLCG